MKLNRKKKPSEPANLMIGRISRRMTNDIGMSPTDLMKIISCRSPSPKKRAIVPQFSTEKENSSKFLNESLLRSAMSSSSAISNQESAAGAMDPAMSDVATSDNDPSRVQLRKIDNNFFGGASRDAAMSSGDATDFFVSVVTLYSGGGLEYHAHLVFQWQPCVRISNGVWFFNGCCVFQPAFGCCAHSKAG